MLEQSVVDGIGVVQLAYGAANALDLELLDQIADTFGELEHSDVKAIVLTGRDGVFSAGADLFRVLEEGSDYLEHAGRAFTRAFKTLFLFPKPVVAAVNGHAIAGGCVLALACDHRVAAEGDYKVGLAELKVGVPFPAWALEIVRFAIAPPYAQELMLTGRLCAPEDAREAGLVDAIVPPSELSTRAVDIAAKLARIPHETFAMTKRTLRAPAAERVEQLGPAFDAAGAAVWGSESVRASIREFLVRTFGTDRRQA